MPALLLGGDAGRGVERLRRGQLLGPVIRQDVRRLQAGAFRDLAVCFGDPPYVSGAALWEQLAPVCRAWMRPEGVLVWETDKGTALPSPPGWEFLESRAYGSVRFHLFRPA